MGQLKLTPKKVALAIGVSESSMKRWCDRGIIQFHTTAGGHRRIVRPSVIDFLRQGNHQLEQPDLIGLPNEISIGPKDIVATRQELLKVVMEGDEEKVRTLILGIFISGYSVAIIADELVVPVSREMVDLRERKQLDAYRERLGSEILLRVLTELSALLADPSETAPLAIGGGPAVELNPLSSALIALVLRQHGWRAKSLGLGLPFSTLAAAAQNMRPHLFWLSVSEVQDSQLFVRQFNEFKHSLDSSMCLVVGGRGLLPEIREQLSESTFTDNLGQLESIVVSLKKLQPSSSTPAGELSSCDPPISNNSGIAE